MCAVSGDGRPGRVVVSGVFIGMVKGGTARVVYYATSKGRCAFAVGRGRVRVGDGSRGR